MADDIVTRLRNECQCSDDCRAVNDPCIPMRAADEIERLRAVCQQFAESADFYESYDGVVKTLRINQQRFVDACGAWGRLIPSERVVRGD